MHFQMSRTEGGRQRRSNSQALARPAKVIELHPATVKRYLAAVEDFERPQFYEVPVAEAEDGSHAIQIAEEMLAEHGIEHFYLADGELEFSHFSEPIEPN
jgi:hypothetical protein